MPPLSTLSLAVSASWLAVHLLHALRKRRVQLLPLVRGYERASFEVHVRSLHLSIKTYTFNAPHDRLRRWLASGPGRLSRNTLRFAYSTGVICCLLGMLAGITLLLWNTIALCTSTFFHRVQSTNQVTLTKRDPLALDTGMNDQSGRQYMLHPIIPGLTVPLSHLPLIFLALSIAQIVHEAGHAIAAAIHDVPILSAGMSVTVILPSAFVSLPSSRLEELTPLERLRIIGAGCCHNLAFWATLMLAAWSGVGHVFWSIVGYKDVSSVGRVVVSIEEGSPLYDYLSPGSLITRLDDMDLGPSKAGEDKWTSYLLEQSSSHLRLNEPGWCASGTELRETNSDCCTNVAQDVEERQKTCFLSSSATNENFCLDPLLIVIGKRVRCHEDYECRADSRCLLLRDQDSIVRIFSRQPGQLDTNTTEVVVWSGLRDEIWEEVQVSTLLPRFRPLPLVLPILTVHLVEYLSMAMVSLYILNMLPLPYLDGSQFFRVLLELLAEDPGRRIEDEYDVESLNARWTGPRETSAQRMVHKFVTIGVTTLVASCTLLGVAQWFIHP
ncbi:hypothetical protein CONPUDRAFT_147066 [Coniophora puteana RWD-64-598 SS2]|uniref:Endopeptidase S2P n=1 Tax=Coniophora puteana (strain RWD-64-598) TaxID=741705 RepID=A0A5M3MAA6_CONPW|nr:uncharacterized protein CONPUDRAFT_147066 [Coniophora puteana RWD-64-598 SS2]EIW76063.1 hypothetical protein CONPUDRAFT_147066 [Coniophora puteana RWD-64-598 SS2]